MSGERPRGAVVRNGDGARVQMIADAERGRIEVTLTFGALETAREASLSLHEFAEKVAYVLHDGAPAGLRTVIREAYAHAGDAVFEAKLRGVTLDLYDVIAEALLERFAIIAKEV